MWKFPEKWRFCLQRTQFQQKRKKDEEINEGNFHDSMTEGDKIVVINNKNEEKVENKNLINWTRKKSVKVSGKMKISNHLKMTQVPQPMKRVQVMQREKFQKMLRFNWNKSIRNTRICFTTCLLHKQKVFIQKCWSLNG